MGIVYSENKKEILGYFEYNGTVDFAYSKVQKTKEGVNKNWNTSGNSGECVCNNKNYIPVVLHSCYGSGHDWESEICPLCMVITGKRLFYRDYAYISYYDD
jgi:hypothetical protein